MIDAVERIRINGNADSKRDGGQQLRALSRGRHQFPRAACHIAVANHVDPRFETLAIGAQFRNDRVHGRGYEWVVAEAARHGLAQTLFIGATRSIGGPAVNQSRRLTSYCAARRG